MTQPTVVYFGPDGGGGRAMAPLKVYLRSLLYTTSKRGRIIQSMYVKLQRGETTQTFNIWVLGEEKLSRGSGLYVGQEGVACNHHFLLPSDGTRYEFLPGHYRLQVYASIVGIRRPVLLGVTELDIADGVAQALRDQDTGLYFDWGPESARYHPHVRAASKAALPPPLVALVGTSEAFGLKVPLSEGEPAEEASKP